MDVLYRNLFSQSISELKKGLNYVNHSDSWLALTVLAFALALLEEIGAFAFAYIWLAMPLAQFIWGSYFYLALVKASSGSLRLIRRRDFVDVWDSFIIPLFRFSIAMIWYIAPLVICVKATVGYLDFIDRLRFNPIALFREEDVLLYLFVGIELIYLPAGLIASIVAKHPLRVLDPIYGLRLILKTGIHYVPTFVALSLLTLVAFFTNSVAEYLRQAMPIPLVVGIIGQLLQLWVPLAQMRILANFIHRHKQVL